MAATLLTEGGEFPVKIRDLSAKGAQIESSLSPDLGSAMTLTRGRLRVEGTVSWTSQQRFGLHFSSPVAVREWMANPLSLEQQRVDTVVAVVKTGAVPLAANRQAEPAGEVADDLAQVAKLLETLGEALADDPAVVTRHGSRLQNIDIAVQTLTALAEPKPADAAGLAARLVRLAELRLSCAQALAAKP